MYKDILYEVEEPVAIVTFNRPDRLNALTSRMYSELKHAFAEAERDERVVGIILTGAGRGFSAGADMQGLSNLAGASDSGDEVGVGRSGNASLEADAGDPAMGPDFEVAFGYFLKVRNPLIAAVNGPAAGLGFVFAMLCDMRFAAENAKFTTAFAARGLIAEHGISWVLPRLIGSARALDLLWSARKFQAQEALELGVVNRVVPEGEAVNAAREYIQELAATVAPQSLMVIKQQVYKHLMQPLGAAWRETVDLMNESLVQSDFKEGVESYLEKRPPKFRRVGTDST